MLNEDEQTVKSIEALAEHEKALQLAEIEKTREKFAALLHDERYQELQQQGSFRLSQKAMLSALFISLYQEEPVFNLPFQVLTCLTEIDENLTIWRYKHAMMVQRMLGTKIGTGGSSGHDYLKRTTEKNRVFTDLFHMATFLIPKASLPQLPQSVRRQLGFYFSGD
jgi:tryptophan 2,3-dioxygenase